MGEVRAARPQVDPLHGILLWCVVFGDGLVASRVQRGRAVYRS